MSNTLQTFTALAGLFGNVGGLFGQGSADSSQATLIEQSMAMREASAARAATVLRQSTKSLRDAHAFNQDVNKLNTKRQLNQVARQHSSLLGRQLTQLAGSGVNVGSKSALMLRNEALDSAERDLLNIQVDAENTRRAERFATEVEEVARLNQASALEYSAKAKNVIAAAQRAQSKTSGLMSNIAGTTALAQGLPTVLSMFQGGKK